MKNFFVKHWHKVVFIALTILMALVINYSSYALWTIISNYESMAPEMLGGFPLYMFIAWVVTFMFYCYRAEIKGLNDAFAKKHYSILGVIFGGLGLVFSILCGTWIYGSFVPEYPIVFAGYPLVMTIVHTALLAIAIYELVKAQQEIKDGNLTCDRKSSVGHVFETMAYVFFTLFGLGRLGAFLCLPLYWSSQNTVYVLPYYLQLLAPISILVCCLLYKDFLGKNKKFGLISTLVIFGVSLLTMTYMIILEKACEQETHLWNATIYINALSQIQNPGRLLTGPINFEIMYVVCYGFTLSNIIVMTIKNLKKSK